MIQRLEVEVNAPLRILIMTSCYDDINELWIRDIEAHIEYAKLLVAAHRQLVAARYNSGRARGTSFASSFASSFAESSDSRKFSKKHFNHNHCHHYHHQHRFNITIFIITIIIIYIIIINIKVNVYTCINEFTIK